MALAARRESRSGARPLGPALPRVSLRGSGMLLTGMFLLLLVDGLVHHRAFFDLWLIGTVQDMDVPLRQFWLRPVDALTSSTGAIIMWSTLLLVFIVARWWLPALAMLTLPAGGVIDNLIGDYLVHHTRPTIDEVVRVADGTDPTSFPSGHVMGAVLLYGLLFLVANRMRNRYLRYTVKSIFIAIISIFGFGRFLYGAHSPV